MTLVLVRDDDANATTRLDRLERTFAPLLDAGIRLNFAVIPAVVLDTRQPNGAREPFIDENEEDVDREATLTDDSPLAVWLRAHADAVDVFLHGLSHRRVRGGTEFGALTFEESAARVQRALEILTAALHRTPIGFVAPWDALSGDALRVMTTRFDLVSMGWVDLRRLPLSAWPDHVFERIGRHEVLRVRSSWLLRYRGGKINERIDPGDVPDIVKYLVHGADVGVVNLHHWMFWSHDGPHPVIVALARALRGYETGTVREAVRRLDELPRLRLPRVDRLVARNVAAWGKLGR